MIHHPALGRPVTRTDAAFVALLVMVVVEVTNLSAVAAMHVALPIFTGSLLLGIVALGLTLTDHTARARLNRWTVVGAVLVGTYMCGQLVATLGSTDLGASTPTLWRAGVDAIYVVIVLMLAQVTARPWALAAAVVVPMAALSMLTVFSFVVFHGATSFGGFATITDASGELVTTQRYGGPFPDSNFWGRHLVLAMPLSWALAHRAWRIDLRGRAVAWGGVTLVLMAGIYLTQSRGTLLAVGAAAVLWLVIAGMPAKLAVLLPAMFAMLLIPGIGNRFVALIADVSGGSHGVDPSVLGRKASQEIAWAMFEQRPLFGYGPGTFSDAIAEYAGRVPTVVHDEIIAPHNLYAQLAAESGWFGLITWIVMIAGFLTLLAVRIAAHPGRDRGLVAAVFTGIVAWSIASLFLHLAYFRTLGLLLALACALCSTAPVGRVGVRRLVNTTARWSGAVVIGAVAAGGILSLSGTSAVTASEKVTLAPVGRPDGYYAYALDVRSRAELLPTFAELMTAPGTPATIESDPVRGTITVSVTAPDSTTARTELDDVMRSARTRIVEFIGPNQYAIVQLSDPSVAGVVLTPRPAMFAAAVAGLAAAAAAGTLLPSLIAAARSRRRGSSSPTSALDDQADSESDPHHVPPPVLQGTMS